MFRRFRHRRWLVAGLGIAALTVPTTALAGNVLDGRSPDTRDASQTAALAEVDPMVVKYLLRYGYTQSQIDAMRAAPPVSVPRPIDPMIDRYLLRYGYTQSQIDAMRAAPAASTTKQLDPMVHKYLLGHGYMSSDMRAMLAGTHRASTPPQVAATPVDGRSPDTVDFAVQAHSPVVTVIRDPGFQWGDFGIGGAAALGAVMLVILSVRFLSNRQDRGQQTPVATA